jgi:hypothetical protein
VFSKEGRKEENRKDVLGRIQEHCITPHHDKKPDIFVDFFFLFFMTIPTVTVFLMEQGRAIRDYIHINTMAVRIVFQQPPTDFGLPYWLSGELHQLGDCSMSYFPCRQRIPNNSPN